MRPLLIALAVSLAAPASFAQTKPTVAFSLGRAGAKPTGTLAPAALHRRLEAELIAARDTHDRAMVRYERALKRFEAGRGAEPIMPRIDFGQARSTAMALLRSHPTYVHADHVLYTLAWCLNEEDKVADAAVMWGRVLARYPKSALRAEVLLRLGEHHFDQAKFAQAAVFYKRASQLPGRFRHLAFYKLGWARYSGGKYTASLRAFGQLMALPVGQILVPEARQYAAIMLAEADWNGDGKADGVSPVARVRKHLKLFPKAARARLVAETVRALREVGRPAAADKLAARYKRKP